DKLFLDAGYLQAAVNHNLDAYIAEARGGGGLAHVNKRTVEDSSIPLPPLAEQERITSAIRDTTRAIDDGDAALTRARATLTQLVFSVLKSAVEGTLSADWRSRNPDQKPARKPLKAELRRHRSSGRSAVSLPLFA